MKRIQSYLFKQVFRSVVVIVGGLTLLAILAQGLSQTDLIVENRQSALIFFYVVALGAPQVIALLTPLAIFVATVWSLNKLHRDNEIVVAGAAGMTRWQISSPIIRLAVLAGLAHLAVTDSSPSLEDLEDLRVEEAAEEEGETRWSREDEEAFLAMMLEEEEASA